jgi:hypothetical protein
MYVLTKLDPTHRKNGDVILFFISRIFFLHL